MMGPKLRVVNVPSWVPYGLPEWRIYGGPDVEVAALLGRTDEGDRPVRTRGRGAQLARVR